jgi:hypothetical protein
MKVLGDDATYMDILNNTPGQLSPYTDQFGDLAAVPLAKVGAKAVAKAKAKKPKVTRVMRAVAAQRPPSLLSQLTSSPVLLAVAGVAGYALWKQQKGGRRR